MASSSSSSIICLTSVHCFSTRSRLLPKQDNLFFNYPLYGTLKNSCFSLKTSVTTTSASSVFTEEAFKDLVSGFSDDEDLVSDFSGDESFSDPRDSQVKQHLNLNAGGKDELSVCNLGLPKLLVDSLERRGITHLFPIQRAVLLPALEGQDLIARAKTGTGKTLAFGIPIIKRLTEDDADRSLQRRSGRLPRVLVLAPTRELARQVEKEIKESAPYLNTICVYGGVSYVQQKSALQRGVDVVVGTPGRIIDLVNSHHLKLGEVKFLVLDEADQMLAVGFEEDVEIILESLPSKRQSMLFSATMPTWVKKLSRKYLDNPLNIDLVGDHDEKLAEGIKLYAISAASSNSKRDILPNLIANYAKGGKTIVFTHTKREADEVSRMLTYCIPSEPLHGDKSQFQREKTLSRFRQGRFSVLVATDVASRGLDIPNVDLVIHYDLPNDAEIFVHRSGRTGRAGKKGTAIVMFPNSQKRTVKSFERDAGCRFEFISSEELPTFSGIYSGSREFFTPNSLNLTGEQEPDSLAAAMAQLNDFSSSSSSSRSLITHEQGWMTLQLTRDLSFSTGFLSARSVSGFLSEVYSPAADEVGKICIIADEMVYGAVFDLPESTARELLNQQMPPGNTISAIKKLPTLQDVGPRRSERFGNKMARGGPRGESRERRGSRIPGGWGSNRNSDDQDRYGRRDRSSRAENSWSGNRRSSTDDWLISGRQSPSRTGSRDRGSFSSSFGSSFGGSCFVCGRSGHRATECPNKQDY